MLAAGRIISSERSMTFYCERFRRPRIAFCSCILALFATSALASTGESEPANLESAGQLDAIQQALAIGSYKECRDPARDRITFACGAQSCPGGTTYVRTVRKAIPECNSSSCVNMKSLGWKRGHKNNFCINRGYTGVRPAPGRYENGGCCFKTP